MLQNLSFSLISHTLIVSDPGYDRRGCRNEDVRSEERLCAVDDREEGQEARGYQVRFFREFTPVLDREIP